VHSTIAECSTLDFSDLESERDVFNCGFDLNLRYSVIGLVLALLCSLFDQLSDNRRKGVFVNFF
jgi:hypothetical protein